VAVNHLPVDWATYVRGAKVVGSVEQLLAALRDATPPSSGVEAIVDATEVLMAAYESVLQGNRPVLLPLSTGDNPLCRKSHRR
jgi:hypothetical protein